MEHKDQVNSSTVEHASASSAQVCTPTRKKEKEFDEEHDYCSTNNDASASEQVCTPRSTENRGGASGSFCCICKVIVFLALVSLSLLYVLGRIPQAVQGIIPDLDLFNSENLGNESMWIQATGQGGLELTLINALDPEWHPYFDLAVEQWDNGTPDSLTLTTQVRSPDPDCSIVPGFLKICNGDYGSTDWEGINMVFLKDGKIESSTGKMNEHFFGQNDGDKRQYTMCHEIGHGFGLPHTDENVWNLDQGNCLDYTNRPRNNKQPGTINFDRLAELYGTVSGNGTLTGGAASNQGNRELVSVKTNGRRNLRKTRVVHKAFPESVLKGIDRIDDLIDNGLIGSKEDGWRFLHESPRGRGHEIDLGSGYTVHIHYLLATNSDT